MAKKQNTKQPPKKSSIITDVAMSDSKSSTAKPANKPYLNRRTLWLIFALLIVALVAYRFKGLFVAAVVNGQPISRLELIKELESQSGRQVLDTLVTEKLIYQKAREASVDVTQDEIDSEINKIKDQLASQGQDLDQLLALQGLSKDKLAQQIKLQKLVEKLSSDSIEVTDQEVSDYIEQNKDTLQGDSDSQELRDQIKDQLQQQKASQAIQSWLVSARGQAKIDYWAQF